MFTIKIEYIRCGRATHRLSLYEDGFFIRDMEYMYYSKREMLRNFKELTGIKGKHNVEILEVF